MLELFLWSAKIAKCAGFLLRTDLRQWVHFQGVHNILDPISWDQEELKAVPSQQVYSLDDRIPSTTPGAEPPRDAKDSGSARSHSTHLETSSSNRP